MRVHPSSGSTCSRREFGTLALSVPLALAGGTQTVRRIDSTVSGVRIGLQTFSFRRLPTADAIIQAMQKIGIGTVELMSNHAEAAAGAPAEPAALRAWRGTVPPNAFTRVRQKFDAAGIALDLLCYNIEPTMTDADIEYGFQMARALGVRGITTSTLVSMAKRIAPFAEKHRLPVGFHNHHHSDGSNPDEIASPASFDACLALSRYHQINLDTGHFTASNFDSVSFIERNHARIISIHLKDRKRNQGAIVPWGTGDAPLAAVLKLMRDRRYTFPANIEFEYPGADPVAEVQKCFDFCRAALA